MRRPGLTSALFRETRALRDAIALCGRLLDAHIRGDTAGLQRLSGERRASLEELAAAQACTDRCLEPRP